MGDPPAQRGRYVLGELLGRGGMGEVFAGYAFGSHGFQKPVAIKRIIPELATDESFVGRLIDEAKLLVGMQHSNIVSVLDLNREGEDVFLVMEFVDGPSLSQLLKARGKRSIPFGITSHIVQSAATGLQFAHARKGGAIIHADVSPGNLLLSLSGEVRVADFGIAQREGTAGGAEGKFAFMAPEQVRGEPLTPRCDVFALGVVLYELVTLRHPFGLHVSAIQRLDMQPIIPPRMLNPEVPAGLDELCMRALAEDPADRTATMQQLLEDLIDQRFENGWREGATELAAMIADVTAVPERAGAGHTSHTGRPVTIATRSLITPSPGDSPFAPEPSDAMTGMFVVPAELVGARDEPDSVPDNEPTDLASTVLPSGELELLAPTGPRAIPTLPRAPTGSQDALAPRDRPTGPAAVDLRIEPDTLAPTGERVLPELAPELEPTSAQPTRGSRKLLVASVLGLAALAGVIFAIIPASEKPPRRVAPSFTLDAAPVLDASPVEIDAPTDAPPDAREPDAAIVDAPPPLDAAAKIAIEPPKKRVPPPVQTPPPPTQTGWLRVETSDGAFPKATLRAETFDVPGANFKLKPGSNTVVVKDATYTRRCTVAFKPGSQTLTVSMKTGNCIVQ